MDTKLFLENTALLIVDVQNDFLPSGSLAVQNGDQVITFINSIMQDYTQVIATKDWHPFNHVSFASNNPPYKVGEVIEVDGVPQILWPDHCIQNTVGAELSSALNLSGITHIIEKGKNIRLDSYSGFFDNHRKQETELHALLQMLGVSNLHICGLATDYCVKFTANDAVELGYQTMLLTNGCRAVNLNHGDDQSAIKEMKSKGIVIK